MLDNYASLDTHYHYAYNDWAFIVSTMIQYHILNRPI